MRILTTAPFLPSPQVTNELFVGDPSVLVPATLQLDEQAEARAADKGRDCAQCAVEMANLVAALEPEADEDEDEGEDLEQADPRR
jgi:hypothetical protein